MWVRDWRCRRGVSGLILRRMGMGIVRGRGLRVWGPFYELGRREGWEGIGAWLRFGLVSIGMMRILIGGLKN